MTEPITDQQLDLDEIEARAAHLHEYGDPTDTRTAGWEELAGTDVPALVTEVRRQRTELERRAEDVAFLERTTLPELRREIEHHKDGKQRWRARAEKADARAAELAAVEMFTPQQCPAGKHADWLVDSEYAHACPWCQIGRLHAESAAVHTFLDEQELAARAFELPTPAWVEAVRAASATGAATGRLGDLPSTEDLAAADNPTPLRWGLNDVLWSDNSVIVMMSGPDREPYWLELDPERAAVLREDLAGPDGAPSPERDALIAELLPAWEAMYEPGNVSNYLIGYANSEAGAKGAAEAWMRSQAEVTGRLEWEAWVDPASLPDGYDALFELIQRHDDGIDTGPGIAVRHRTTTDPAR
ncbi:MAG: hypothetical protein JF621_27710 [Streptomyces turgidiscabies]|nr:hypothetical protein [Streptomyces turgidiscabies]